MRSLGNSVNKLEKLLKDNPECMILCITEHWKSQDQLDQLGLENFKSIASVCREAGQHGGSAIYVRNPVMARKREIISDLSVIGEFECSAVECVINKLTLVILSVYRPPGGGMDLFFDLMENILFEKIVPNSIIFIVGDFNIEMKDENSVKNRLFTLFNNFSIRAQIDEYTRITEHSKSCLDNIFTNFSSVISAEVLEYHISDHMAQKVCFRISNRVETEIVRKRFINESNKTIFMHKLEEQTWDNVYLIDEHDVNEQWLVFVNQFLNIFNECFPLTPVYKNRKVIKKNDNIESMKQQLDTLMVLSGFDVSYKIRYNQCKREYDELLKLEKRKSYDERIGKSDCKIKSMWAICREITGKNITHEQNFCEDPLKLANDFNKYLVKVIQDIQLGREDTPFVNIIPENDRSMFLKPVSVAELVELSNHLKNKHCSGYDDIPVSIVKSSITVISTILCYILNNSMKFSIFPNRLKHALIKPLFKKGDPNDLDNYRPISLLPAFSRIFELVMCSRLLSFMNECNLFSQCQHGYLRGRSTDTAIYQFINAIIDHLENKNLALGLFIDLKKAYDCVDHDILLQKLDRYGVRGRANDWIRSFLSDRCQQIVVDNKVKSEVSFIDVGIAQGSLAGPILFIIYINDLPLSLNKYLITNYVDDTNILLHGNSSNEIIEQTKNCYNEVDSWFSMNRLVINTSKTSLVFFRTKQSQTSTPSSINLENNIIEPVSSTKFLGIQIDEFLDWEIHINKLCLRLASVGYGIRVVAQYMNEGTLKILYHANCESIIRFGIIFWGGNSRVQSIFIAQKRIIRTICKMKYRDSCRGKFRNMNIMTVYALYIYECLLFVFKNRDKFDMGVSHNYNTRTQDLLYPYHRLTLSEKGPYYMCIKIFNRLPNYIKCCDSLYRFKKIVKRMLIHLEPYNCGDYFVSENLCI